MQLSNELIKEIPRLKLKYGSIYLIDLNKIKTPELAPGYVVIRPLTRREFNFYSPYINDSNVQLEIINKCVIAPKDPTLDSYLSGVDDVIIRGVIKISGFSSEEELAVGIDQSRKNAATLESVMTLFICKAFPTYRPDDIDNMNFEKIITLASQAEQLLQAEIPYLKHLYPDKYKDKNPKQKQSIRNRKQEPPPPPPGWQSSGKVDNFTESLNDLNNFLNG